MVQTSGRPRAVDTEERMTAAAIDVYGRLGWERFSIAAVAQQAGLGKSSGYLRWKSKADLLADALARYGAHVQDVDTGTIRSDLITLGTALHAVFAGPAGVANRRLQIDAHLAPELARVESDIRQTQTAAAREIVRRGIRRGEIPPSTSISLLLNAVCGGVINDVASRPPKQAASSPQHAVQFCERLVDLVLSGIRS